MREERDVGEGGLVNRGHAEKTVKTENQTGGQTDRQTDTQTGNKNTQMESPTSTSQRAFELVASVFLPLPVVLRNTLWVSSIPLVSPVRNFSCSAWNSRTMSPWEVEGRRTSESAYPNIAMCCTCVCAKLLMYKA